MNSAHPSVSSLVFLGAGNMAEALCRGILSAGLLPPEAITLTDVRPERLEALSKTYGVKTATDNRVAVAGADVVMLCVKPQQMPELLAEVKGAAPDALWISIAAGVTLSAMESRLGEGSRMVRVMPNTPALVREGAAGIAPGAQATAADLALAMSLFACVGDCVEVTEPELHAVTALSGSGPAYVFVLVEAMLAAAGEMGFAAEAARALVLQTVRGAAVLLQETGEPPEVLRARVTSKGGTTAAAVAAFEAAGVPEALRAGVLAAARRSAELAGDPPGA